MIVAAFILAAALPSAGTQAQTTDTPPWVWDAADIPAEVFDIGGVVDVSDQGLGLFVGHQRTGSIGVGTYTLGSVNAVALDSIGGVIVDALSPRVIAVTREGEVRWHMSRVGDGPLDLAMPVSALITDHTLLIGNLDGEVGEYDLSTGEPEYRRRRRLTGPVYDMCASRRSVWLQSWDSSSGTLARRVDDSVIGGESRGIARLVPNGGGRRSGYALGGAFVECMSDGLIVVAPQSVIPEVRAFREDGHLVWRLRLEGYQPVGLTLVRDGFRVLVPSGGYHRVQSVVEIPGEGILVQIGKVTRESLAAGMVVENLSLLLDEATGRVLDAARGGPRVHEVKGDCVAVTPNQLEPEVRFLCR